MHVFFYVCIYTYNNSICCSKWKTPFVIHFEMYFYKQIMVANEVVVLYLNLIVWNMLFQYKIKSVNVSFKFIGFYTVYIQMYLTIRYLSEFICTLPNKSWQMKIHLIINNKSWNETLENITVIPLTLRMSPSSSIVTEVFLRFLNSSVNLGRFPSLYGLSTGFPYGKWNLKLMKYYI